MDCPFCRRPMRPGLLRSRGYATVWTPAESGRSPVPPPFDLFSRRRRREAVVVGNIARSAYRCASCEAVLVVLEPPAAGPG